LFISSSAAAATAAAAGMFVQIKHFKQQYKTVVNEINKAKNNYSSIKPEKLSKLQCSNFTTLFSSIKIFVYACTPGQLA